MGRHRTNHHGQGSNVGQLKAALTSLSHEINVFESVIEKLKAAETSSYHGYKLPSDLAAWMSDVKSQSISKDPSAASVYFVKILMDCLCMGPATEKELRNAVIEKCKLSGVKSTTRGTVSGLNIEVSSVCGVLAAMGILVPANDIAAGALLPLHDSKSKIQKNVKAVVKSVVKGGEKVAEKSCWDSNNASISDTQNIESASVTAATITVPTSSSSSSSSSSAAVLSNSSSSSSATGDTDAVCTTGDITSSLTHDVYDGVPTSSTKYDTGLATENGNISNFNEFSNCDGGSISFPAHYSTAAKRFPHITDESDCTGDSNDVDTTHSHSNSSLNNIHNNIVICEKNIYGTDITDKKDSGERQGSTLTAGGVLFSPLPDVGSIDIIESSDSNAMRSQSELASESGIKVRLLASGNHNFEVMCNNVITMDTNDATYENDENDDSEARDVNGVVVNNLRNMESTTGSTEIIGMDLKSQLSMHAAQIASRAEGGIIEEMHRKFGDGIEIGEKSDNIVTEMDISWEPFNTISGADLITPNAVRQDIQLVSGIVTTTALGQMMKVDQNNASTANDDNYNDNISSQLNHITLGKVQEAVGVTSLQEKEKVKGQEQWKEEVKIENDLLDRESDLGNLDDSSMEIDEEIEDRNNDEYEREGVLEFLDRRWGVLLKNYLVEEQLRSKLRMLQENNAAAALAASALSASTTSLPPLSTSFPLTVDTTINDDGHSGPGSLFEYSTFSPTADISNSMFLFNSDELEDAFCTSVPISPLTIKNIAALTYVEHAAVKMSTNNESEENNNDSKSRNDGKRRKSTDDINADNDVRDDVNMSDTSFDAAKMDEQNEITNNNENAQHNSGEIDAYDKSNTNESEISSRTINGSYSEKNKMDGNENTLEHKPLHIEVDDEVEIETRTESNETTSIAGNNMEEIITNEESNTSDENFSLLLQSTMEDEFGSDFPNKEGMCILTPTNASAVESQCSSEKIAITDETQIGSFAEMFPGNSGSCFFEMDNGNDFTVSKIGNEESYRDVISSFLCDENSGAINSEISSCNHDINESNIGLNDDTNVGMNYAALIPRNIVTSNDTTKNNDINTEIVTAVNTSLQSNTKIKQKGVTNSLSIDCTRVNDINNKNMKNSNKRTSNQRLWKINSHLFSHHVDSLKREDNDFLSSNQISSNGVSHVNDRKIKCEKTRILRDETISSSSNPIEIKMERSSPSSNIATCENISKNNELNTKRTPSINFDKKCVAKSSRELRNLLRNPESKFSAWTDACYEEACVLELEESILRRILGQCELQIPCAAVRPGTKYLNNTVNNSTKNKDISTNNLHHSNNNNSININNNNNYNNYTGSSSGGFRENNHALSIPKTANPQHSKLKTVNRYSTIPPFENCVKNSPTNNTNNSAILSFRDGQQFTATDLWQRMKSKGSRRNFASGNAEHARIPQHSTYPYSDSKNQNQIPNTTTKGVHRKNSFCHSNSENSLTLSQGNLSNGHSRKIPQPLSLRKDLVTYSDGSYCLDNGLGLSAPPSPSNPFPSFTNKNANSRAGGGGGSVQNNASSSSSSSIQPNQSHPSSTNDPSSPHTSLTTSFSTSQLSLALLSNQRMGTVVLPDLVILTNEIPWCSVASEFAVLTADDIAFDLFGNEIDATTAAKVHTVEKEKEVEDTRKRSASEGNYEKKRKYQRKNSISSCAGFSSTSDYGLVDIDCSSGDFEELSHGLHVDTLDTNEEASTTASTPTDKLHVHVHTHLQGLRNGSSRSSVEKNSTDNNNVEKSSGDKKMKDDDLCEEINLKRRRSKSFSELLLPQFKEIVPITSYRDLGLLSTSSFSPNRKEVENSEGSYKMSFETDLELDSRSNASVDQLLRTQNTFINEENDEKDSSNEMSTLITDNTDSAIEMNSNDFAANTERTEKEHADDKAIKIEVVKEGVNSKEEENEEEEEDLSDVAVEARHEGMLKKMRDRWALLQRLRVERKFDLLGVAVCWEEGGQAIGADGEVMARGGGNGAYSGIQSAIKGPGSTGTMNLAYGQTMVSPRPSKKNKNGFGRYKSSKSGVRKRGRPPKNCPKIGEKIDEMDIYETENVENENGDFEREDVGGDDTEIDKNASSNCESKNGDGVDVNANVQTEKGNKNTANSIDTGNMTIPSQAEISENQCHFGHSTVSEKHGKETDKSENLKRKTSSVHFEEIQNFPS